MINEMYERKNKALQACRSLYARTAKENQQLRQDLEIMTKGLRIADFQKASKIMLKKMLVATRIVIEIEQMAAELNKTIAEGRRESIKARAMAKRIEKKREIKIKKTEENIFKKLRGAK